MKAKILTVGISLVLFIATLAFAQSRDRWGAGAGVPLAASPQVVLTHLSAERWQQRLETIKCPYI